MKKRIFCVLVTLFALTTSLFCLTACGENPDTPSGHEHSYTEQVTTESYLATEATCTQKATYYYSCSCGEKGTNTFEYGEALGHDCEYVANNDGTHTATCKIIGCDYSTTENCSGGTISCTEPTRCEHCNEIYIYPQGHRYTEEVAEEKYLMIPATCEGKAVYFKSCTCGEVVPEEQFDFIDDCFEYGEALGHSFSNYVSNNDADCENDGTKTAHCEREECSESDTVAEVGSALGHDYGAWVNDGNGNHVKTCSRDSEHVVSEACSGGTASCTQKAVCSVCHEKYGEKLAHNFEGDVCSVCGAKKPSEGLNFNLTWDEKSYRVSGIGTCTDTVIVIPETYKGLPVTGIESEAFKYRSTIVEVVIPDGVTSIGYNAFGGCSGLVTVTIPDSVTDIGTDAFIGCASNLSSVYYTGSVNDWAEISFYNYNSNPVYYAKRLYINGEPLTTVNITTTSKIGGFAFISCVEVTSVTIGDSVASIGDSAFAGCNKITSLTFGENVESIGKNAFYNCSNLMRAIIPDSVTSIGESAFYGCSELCVLTFGKNVESIGREAFENCSSLTEVVLPDKLTIIDVSLFYDCSSLTSVTIGANVTELYGGNGHFAGCYKLENIYFKGDLKDWVQIKGLVGLTYHGKAAKNLYIKGQLLTEVNIENSDKIEDYAFYGTSITSVTIGDGVTSVGMRAFAYCSNLTSIVIGDSVTSLGHMVIERCSHLSTITIGKGITDLKNICNPCSIKNIYYTGDVNGWVQIKNLDCVMYVSEYSANIEHKLYIQGKLLTEANITTASKIENNAFAVCKTLTSVTIGDSVTSIGGNVFYECSELDSVTFGKNVESIGYNAFNGCTKLTSIVIPDSVTSLGSGVFKDCTELATVSLGNNIESIESFAFYNCEKLASIVIPDSVTSIGVYAFMECDLLESVTFGKNVESIDSQAFWGCDKLKSVTLPDKVKTMGNSVFENCTSLVSVVIGNGLEALRYWTFHNCSSLTTVTISGSVKTIGSSAFKDCTSLKNLTIGNGVEDIGENSFNGCEKLTNVVIPDSVKSIGAYAFGGCYKISSLILGNGIESIGNNAFINCINLTSVVIPESLTSAGSGVFSGCNKLVEIINKSELSDFGTYNGESKIDNQNGFLFYTEEGVNYLLGYVGTQTELVLPKNYNGENYAIYEYAFIYNDIMTSVTIPSGIIAIGDCAFNDCTELTEINYNVATLTNNRSSNIFDNVGINGTGITLNIGKTVTNIPNYLFYPRGDKECAKITSIVFEEGSVCTEINTGAFMCCSALESVYIPANVTSIRSEAFLNCKALTTVTIECGYVAKDAFNSCSSLTNLTLGVGINLDNNVQFNNCENLTEITYKGTMVEWKATTYAKYNNVYTVHCTDGDINGDI